MIAIEIATSAEGIPLCYRTTEAPPTTPSNLILADIPAPPYVLDWVRKRFGEDILSRISRPCGQCGGKGVRRKFYAASPKVSCMACDGFGLIGTGWPVGKLNDGKVPPSRLIEAARAWAKENGPYTPPEPACGGGVGFRATGRREDGGAFEVNRSGRSTILDPEPPPAAHAYPDTPTHMRIDGGHLVAIGACVGRRLSGVIEGEWRGLDSAP